MSHATSERVPATAPVAADAGARRTRLREFQVQLVERMQAARSGVLPQASQLGVLIGQNRWLLNLRQAGEIVPVGALTPVPLTHDWFLGLANLRGSLTSVVDLARFFGQERTPVNKESRIVGFSPALSFNCGLLVSRVMGLRSVAHMQAQPSAPGSAAPWIGRQYADDEAQIWTELDLSFIVQEPRFLQIGL